MPKKDSREEETTNEILLVAILTGRLACPSGATAITLAVAAICFSLANFEACSLDTISMMLATCSLTDGYSNISMACLSDFAQALMTPVCCAPEHHGLVQPQIQSASARETFHPLQVRTVLGIQCTQVLPIGGMIGDLFAHGLLLDIINSPRGCSTPDHVVPRVFPQYQLWHDAHLAFFPFEAVCCDFVKVQLTRLQKII